MALIEERQDSQGRISYRVRVRLKGYPPQTATFKRKTDAAQWAVHTESAIREGRHFKTREAKKHTLDKLIDRYIENVLPTKTDSQKFIQNQKAQLEWWRSKLGYYVIADVTPALVAEYRDKISTKDKKHSPSTINRYLAALSHVFTVAVNEWGWAEDNPVRKVTKMREPRGRVRFLSDEEREKLLEACKVHPNKSLYVVVVLAISTGARLMEVMSLKWQDVDLKTKRVILHDTKNGERRVLHLAGLAFDLVEKHHKDRDKESALVFPGRSKEIPMKIDKFWQEAIKAAELENFRFHDLRHSAASYLAMNGASLAEIAEILGHKTLQMVKRYAHLSEAHTSKVVASMNERIFGDG